jgi:hypothetical protein
MSEKEVACFSESYYTTAAGILLHLSRLSSTKRHQLPQISRNHMAIWVGPSGQVVAGLRCEAMMNFLRRRDWMLSQEVGAFFGTKILSWSISDLIKPCGRHDAIRRHVVA